MTQFLDIFMPIQKGNFGLTDEAIYKSIQSGGQFIPVYGGTEEHVADRFVSEYGRTKYDEPITIFNGDGIIISLDGSSGCMTYVAPHKFALNHHAGFFGLLEKPKQTVIPEFFSLFFEKQLQEASISEGSKTLNLKTIESMDFNIPKHNVQEKIMQEVLPLLKIKEVVNDLLLRINYIKKSELSIIYQKYQVQNIKLPEILDCYGGNSGLTEEEIYRNILKKGERYDVLSSSTAEDTRLGKIPISSINGKQLKVFENKEGILVIRNGKAGTTYFLGKGKYTTTDHAYILALKKDCKYMISLKWFMNHYRQEFFKYTSSTANATWNMTGFFNETIVDIPSYEEQLEVVKKYERLALLETKMEDIQLKINRIFDRQIVS